ncbi:MAG: hypothetical protein ACTSUE_25420 [Promethearchaeota archaeon]
MFLRVRQGIDGGSTGYGVGITGDNYAVVGNTMCDNDVNFYVESGPDNPETGNHPL